jgi:tRNA pseudouridine synthase 10
MLKGEDVNILEVAESLLENYSLCDNCLGRQFALLSHGLTNRERGEAIKLILTLEADRLLLEGNEDGKALLEVIASKGYSKVAAENLEERGLPAKNVVERCYLCDNVFKRIQHYAEKAVKELEDYEFETFLVGVSVPVEIENREDELRSKFNIKWGENIRNELSREIGRVIASLTKKKTDFKKPQALAVIKPFSNSISLSISPLFISGRYRKNVRGIPQSKWICSRCKGKGCPHCDGKGRMYKDSVEEYIGAPLLKTTAGEDTRFHAAGREDVDARVLGTGRPFVIEVKKPKRRKIKLRKLQREIAERSKGKIEVSGLKTSSRDKMVDIKRGEHANKSYRAVIKFENKIVDEKLMSIKESLTGSIIHQLTPIRVVHRRADKIRKRRVFDIKLKRLKPKTVEILILCQGGLYIKELITGDKGRTNPNISDLADNPAKCMEIDVLKVIEGKAHG